MTRRLLNAKDPDGVIHQVMVNSTTLEHGRTRCQRRFCWPMYEGRDRMDGTEEKVSCVLCLGHWSTP